jgi:hypothetical protein
MWLLLLLALLCAIYLFVFVLGQPINKAIPGETLEPDVVPGDRYFAEMHK